MEYTTKTLKQIIAENENIFDKAINPIKQRHGGLTIKLSKDGEKYKYNVVTILGSEKVIDITKKIIDFKKQQWAIIKENDSLQNEEMESLNKELTQATHKAYTSENNEEKIESLRKKNFLKKKF